MAQNLKDPKDKANELVLLALSINPNLGRAKEIAKKIAKHICVNCDRASDYIFNVTYFIDKIDI